MGVEKGEALSSRPSPALVQNFTYFYVLAIVNYAAVNMVHNHSISFPVSHFVSSALICRSGIAGYYVGTCSQHRMD